MFADEGIPLSNSNTALWNNLLSSIIEESKNIALNITSREKFKQYLENISVMEITHSVENI